MTDVNDNDKFYHFIYSELDDALPGEILAIPGVWEPLSEWYNNAWVEHCQEHAWQVRNPNDGKLEPGASASSRDEVESWAWSHRKDLKGVKGWIIVPPDDDEYEYFPVSGGRRKFVENQEFGRDYHAGQWGQWVDVVIDDEE